MVTLGGRGPSSPGNLVPDPGSLGKEGKWNSVCSTRVGQASLMTGERAVKAAAIMRFGMIILSRVAEGRVDGKNGGDLGRKRRMKDAIHIRLGCTSSPRLFEICAEMKGGDMR